MTNNLSYEIKEINNENYFNNEIDNDILFLQEMINNENNFFDSDISLQYSEYNDKYTVKLLKHIALYYDLPIRKKKDDLICSIIEFENDIKNSTIVYNRIRLWNYIKDLKNDKYLNKFITF